MSSKCCSAPVIETTIANGFHIKTPGEDFDEHRAMLMSTIESIFGHDWAKNEAFDAVFPEEHMYDIAIYGIPEIFARICQNCYSVEQFSTNIKEIRKRIDVMINELVEYNWQRVPYEEDTRPHWPGFKELKRIYEEENPEGLGVEDFVDFVGRKFKFKPAKFRKSKVFMKDELDEFGLD